MKQTAPKLISILLLFLLCWSLCVNLSFASYWPDPGPDLSRIYIQSNGSVQPETSLLEKTGNVYKLTGDIVEYTIEIQCDHIVLDGAGYTIYGDADRIKGYDDGNNGVVVNEHKNLTIQNINFEQGAIGIRISNSSNLIIVDNSFSNGILTGLTLQNSTQIFIQNNAFINLNTDINVPAVMLNGSQITFQNNTITDKGYGVEVRGSSNVISDNVIGGTSQSIILKKTDSNIISRNNATGDVYIVDCSNSTFFGNNLNGVRLLFGSNNTFFGNYLATNRGLSCAIEFDDLAVNNTFYGNIFDLNCKICFSDSGPTFWDNGTIGNYWDSYTGIDNNGDGIGDTPYVINENNQDNYPLVDPTIVPEFTSWTPLLIMVVVVVAVIVIFRHNLHNQNQRGEK